MLAGLIGVAAATVALASGNGPDDGPQRAAIAKLPLAPTPTPTAGGHGPPRAVRLTIGVSGDLLPHLPIVARAHRLAGGRGYDFRPLLRPIRPWVRANSLSFCHIETPLTPAPPVGYPRFNSPLAPSRRPGLMRAAPPQITRSIAGRPASTPPGGRWPLPASDLPARSPHAAKAGVRCCCGRGAYRSPCWPTRR